MRRARLPNHSKATGPEKIGAACAANRWYQVVTEYEVPSCYRRSSSISDNTTSKLLTYRSIKLEHPDPRIRFQIFFSFEFGRQSVRSHACLRSRSSRPRLYPLMRSLTSFQFQSLRPAARALFRAAAILGLRRFIPRSRQRMVGSENSFGQITLEMRVARSCNVQIWAHERRLTNGGTCCPEGCRRSRGLTILI